MNTANLANNPFANAQNSLIYGENAISVQQSANGLGNLDSALLFDSYDYGFGYDTATFDMGMYDSMMFDPAVMGGGMYDPMIFDPALMGVGGGMYDPMMFDPALLGVGGGIGGGDLTGGLGLGGFDFQGRMDQLDQQYHEQMGLIWGD